MKKLFLSLVAAMMTATVSFAQGSLLATLSHDGTISAFYGANALKLAVTAAEDGDAITLSSGQFNAVNITKAVVLRGAGMSVSTDSINSHEPTIIQGSFTINVADSIEERLTMEGLYVNGGVTFSGTLKNAQFLKCRFQNFLAATNAVITNTSFIHCRFYKGYKQNANSNAYFINCLVCGPNSPSTSSSIEFDNCFVKFESGLTDYYAKNTVNTYYKNCIIQTVAWNDEDMQIPANCTAYNCVGVGSARTVFTNMNSKNSTNKYVSTINSVFKTYSATAAETYINDSYNFELTQTAATTYLGTDGTQVGVYGGNLPYDENPTIPQITKCNVASKSTADGKLSVDIEVKAAEY